MGIDGGEVVAGYKLQVAGHKFQVTSCRLQVAGH